MEETELNRLTERIIECAIEVHRQLEPGLLESVYESAMCIELDLAGLTYERLKVVPVIYKGQLIGEHRLDLLVEDTVVVELKRVERFDPVFQAQVLSCLKLTGKPVGLLLNLNTRLAKEGIHRYRM
jgi:GxxExxY protein